MDPNDLALALAKASSEQAQAAEDSLTPLSSKTGENSSTPVRHSTVSFPSILKPPRSNNKPGYKYKYPEAAPTPEGEDDDEWNKVYTAADSRFYNKHGKSSGASKKYRQSGETYELAMTMMAEKKQKARSDYDSQLAGRPILPPGKAPTAVPKPKVPKPTPPPNLKQENSSGSRDGTPGFERIPLSISEQIKQEGRARKAPTPSSQQDTPASDPVSKGSSPAPKMEKPPPLKIDKPAFKKKGTAVKKPTKPPSGNSKPHGKSANPNPAQNSFATSDSESNDGGEYCICRGPDDHRMMVNCEGGCNEWYHCSCIGMNLEDAKELLDRYICDKCKTDETYTTWKRMCRYHNVGISLKLANPCRKAARVTDDPPSKYCSDEHRLAFMKFVRDHMSRQDNAPTMGGRLNKQEVAQIVSHIHTGVDLSALGKKPRLPMPEGADPCRQMGLDHITPEEKEELDALEVKKDEIKIQIEGYKNQQKLLLMVHERAQKAISHSFVTEKSICGYDNRLAFNSYEFAHWLSTSEGKIAFETGALGPRTAETKSISSRIYGEGQIVKTEKEAPEELGNICLKSIKGCVRHKGWRIIHGQDYAAMTALAQREWERLERRAAEIVGDAETREATRDYHAHNTVEQLF